MKNYAVKAFRSPQLVTQSMMDDDEYPKEGTIVWLEDAYHFTWVDGDEDIPHGRGLTLHVITTDKTKGPRSWAYLFSDDVLKVPSADLYYYNNYIANPNDNE